VDTDVVELPVDKVAAYLRLLERVYLADSTRTFYKFPGSSEFLVVGFPRQLNTGALLPAFRQIEGVVSADPDTWGGYGNARDIRVLPLGAGQVRFEYSDENCMTWKFRVTPDSVAFLGSEERPC
jgi:hypothetical protein